MKRFETNKTEMTPYFKYSNNVKDSKALLLNERGFKAFSYAIEFGRENGRYARQETRYIVECSNGKEVFNGRRQAYYNFVNQIDINGTYSQDLEF